MTEAGFPMYVVVDEESGDTLVTAEEVAGFFVDPQEELPEVAFLRVHDLNKSRRRAEDAALEIVNRRGERIGEYPVGRVVYGDMGAESADGKISSVSIRHFDTRCEYPEAAEIWRRWAADAALEKGEWLRWPVSYQSSWLHVVQNSWFTSNRRAARYGVDDVVYLDGSHISTKSGFFCALGEAVNGPGGYFGSNLDAVADCMYSSFGEGPPAAIVWRNFQASQEPLGHVFVDSIIDVMREFSVDVTTC
ncbi:barstar family protein [Streptomyces sp. RPT161]|uniref:barstar family protein n=1 Tax=Streptomyces sp. RPT161 TaxID=3015993 RepID=UPI0022B8A247|nr:barstar family protein [Streptomyces sp. RPT161]